MKTDSARLTLVLALCLLVAACANPAEDKPVAAVGEPARPAESAPAPPAAGERYVVSAESMVGFTGSKVTGKHDGGFRAFTGTVDFVDGDPTRSRIELTIDTSSIWTDNPKLTGHLQSADFFDVARYPTATFASTSITGGPETFTVAGDLTLHGVTKNITFPARIEREGLLLTAASEFVLDRFDFGIVYPGAADDLIRKEVVVRFHLKASPAT
jgi:polyisoprenoid-binding protein YceI